MAGEAPSSPHAAEPAAKASNEVEASADKTTPPHSTAEDGAPVISASGSNKSNSNVVLEDRTDNLQAAENSERSGNSDDTPENKKSGISTELKSAKKSTTTPKAARKKSSANMKTKTPKKPTDLKLDPGNHVLAKMRSYPPWPAIILSEELLPDALKGGPPKGGKVPSEGWKTHYPIMYMGTFEYSWTGIGDLEPITDAKKEKGPTKKTKALLAAFENLEQGFSLDDVKGIQRNTMQVDESEAQEDDAMDVDDEEPESEEDVPKKSTSKKRKAYSDDDDEVASDKPAKTPKKELKTKAKTPKTAKSPKNTANGAAKSTSKVKPSDKKDKRSVAPKSDRKKPTPSAASKRGTKAKSAETVQSDSDDARSNDSKPVDPSSLDAEKKHDLMMHRRHRLQKAFLNKEGTMPSDEEMPLLDECLSSLENWNDLDADLIQSTKINKVLKGIIKLTAIPRDEELQFKARSAKLYEKWNAITAASEKQKKENGTSNDKDEKPVANGNRTKHEKNAKVDKDDEKAENYDTKGEESLATIAAAPNEAQDNEQMKGTVQSGSKADEGNAEAVSTANRDDEAA